MCACGGGVWFACACVHFVRARRRRRRRRRARVLLSERHCLFNLELVFFRLNSEAAFIELCPLRPNLLVFAGSISTRRVFCIAIRNVISRATGERCTICLREGVEGLRVPAFCSALATRSPSIPFLRQKIGWGTRHFANRSHVWRVITDVCFQR